MKHDLSLTARPEPDTTQGEPRGEVVADSAQRGGDAARTHRARYEWPIGDTRAQASFNVETRTAPDGRMTTWRYRAQAGATPDAPPAATDGDASAPSSPFVYRHAQTSIEMADADHAITGHAHAFARESFVDELAGTLGRDPVALRLQHLDASRDAGPREIIRMVSERAAWGEPAAADAQARANTRVSGRGFAFDGAGTLAAPLDSGKPPADAAHESDPHWSAWVVDLDVDRATGDVAVRRVVAGQGAGEPGQPSMAGLPAWQIEAAISRVMGARLSARPAHDETGHGLPPDTIAHELVAFDPAAAGAEREQP